MSTNRYLGVNGAPARPIEKSARFTSQWAIPQPDPQEQPIPKRKRRQFNNIVVLFIIYVFKQTNKNLFQNRPKGKYQMGPKRNG